MLQLQNFSRVFLVFLTAPLGLIGVTIALLLFNQPFGFVAMLGTIALSGMIMRNSVILVDQIDQDRAAGVVPWQAIVESTIRRFRPIVLTACCGYLSDDSANPKCIFWPNGCRYHGRISNCDFVDRAIFTRSLCRLVWR